MNDQLRKNRDLQARVRELEEQYAELKDDRNHSDELLHRVQVMFKPDALGYCWQGNGSIYESIKQLQAHLSAATARVKLADEVIAEARGFSEWRWSLKKAITAYDQWLAAEPKEQG